MERRMNQKGMIFVSAMVVMLVLFNLGLGYVISARTEIEIAQSQRQALKAFYFSESAIAHAVADIKKNGAAGGNIAPQDLDGDGVMDYSSMYSMGMKEITGYGGDSTGQEARKTIKVKVTVTPWTGALQIGTGISATSGNAGVITGNVDARSGISLVNVTVNGTITQNNTPLLIPSVALPAYQAIADYTYAVNQTWDTAPPAGIHHVTGNVTINGMSAFTLNGSIIATGSITFSTKMGAVTITPTGSNPALVAGTALSMFTVPATVNINGLIYANNNITLSSVTGPLVINGAIASRASGLGMSSVANINLTFDENINPPYFTGGGTGQILVSSWKPQ